MYGRLKKATLGGSASAEYTYDRYGNILTIVTDGQTGAALKLGVNAATNKLTVTQSPTGEAYTYAEYDAAGNVVRTPNLGDMYVYDGTNVMTESTVAGTNRLYLYTASGERLAAITMSNGVKQRADWTVRHPSGRVLRRFTELASGGWKWEEDYIYRGGQLLAAEIPGPDKTLHFHLDHLGTPRLITGNGGAQIAEHTYYPFGPEQTSAGQDTELLKFTGHERDTSSLDYMHARYYTPAWGRFLSADPVLGEPSRPQTWNRYSYANNNPANVIDPKGMYETNCANSDIECGLNAAYFEGARSQALASDNAAARAAAAAYGELGEANGVLVTFGATSNGTPAETAAETAWSMQMVVGPPGSDGTRHIGTGAATPLWGVTVTFDGASAITPANVAHEGVHVSHALPFFRSWDGIAFNDSLRVTQYFTESAAYNVTAAFTPRNGTMTVGGQHVFRHGMNAEQRQAVVDAILRDPSLKYRISPTNQGGSWPP